MICPVTGCTIEATGLGLCRGHFQWVPGALRREIQELCKRSKGTPAHQGAIVRAVQAVRAASHEGEGGS